QVRMRDLKAVERAGSRQHERLSELLWTDALKPAASVIEPNHDVVGVQEVRPDEIVVAVVVYVSGEDRTALAGQRVEAKKVERLWPAEAGLGGLGAARARGG